MDDISLKLKEIEKFLPKSDEEAEERYKEFKNKDPFPEIPPALLNTADIIDYIITTGMIYPFYPRKESLKPASYGVAFLGKCVFFEKGKKYLKDIKKNEKFILKQNQLAFLTLEPHFRIPNYIGLRFNLKITNIYRGLLVGTGPLVDPGYEGKVTIPLHNLTTTDYTFVGGEDVVYFEFTKLSPSDYWEREKIKLPSRGVYVEFPESKNKRGDVEDYLAMAAKNLPVQSIMTDIIERLNKSEKLLDKYKNIAIITILGIIITAYFGFSSIIQESINLTQNTNSLIKQGQTWQLEFESKMNTINYQSKQISTLNDEVIKLKSKIDSLESKK